MLKIDGIEVLDVKINGRDVSELYAADKLIWSRAEIGSRPYVKVHPVEILLDESNGYSADIQVYSNTDWKVE